MVREAVGLAAYAAGDWTTAIAELRTYHRMTGRQTHLAELADCERALGRPERAIDLYRGADIEKMDKSGAIELLIVAAGARGDLGQHDAAVAMLQVRELTGDDDAEWAARLRYAYADALLAGGRRDEAREWFSRAAAADEDQLTDAAERLLELDGVTIEGDDEEPDDDADTAETASAADKGDENDRADDDEDGDRSDRADDLDDELDDDGDEADDEFDDDEDDEPTAATDLGDDEPVADQDDDEPVAGEDDAAADEDDAPVAVADTDVNTDAVVTGDEVTPPGDATADEKAADDEFAVERKRLEE